MAESKSTSAKKQKLETVEPIGLRILIRKDEDKKITKGGVHLPDKLEIPTLTGRIGRGHLTSPLIAPVPYA